MTANAGYHTFATGDVLTAAQVQYNLQNQVVMYFADATARTTALSAVLVEGMVSYLASTKAIYTYSGSAWVAVGGTSGLTLINRTAFSSQASVTIDSLFSSTYKTYMIVIEDINAATATDDLLFQLRYGSTTVAAGYYGSVWWGAYGGTSGNYTTANAAAFNVLANARGNMVMWINNVGNSSQTAQWHGTAFDGQETKTNQFAGLVSAAQTYTGILIKSSSTNITGSIAIYGLAI